MKRGRKMAYDCAQPQIGRGIFKEKDMAENHLNGSVELLAKAMRKVFVEAVQEGIEPLSKKFDGLEGRFDKLGGRMDKLEGRMDKLEGNVEKLDTRMSNMESNVQAQLAQNRKDIANDVRKALGIS